MPGFPRRAPHATTITNWALKVGLFKLKNAQKQNGGWTAIADLSIQVGKNRVACILRAQQQRINEGRPLTLQDIEVVGLSVKESFAQERLLDFFSETFQKVGFPDALVIDGGADVRKAAFGVNERLGSRILLIDDITHLCGRLLKKGLSEAHDQVDAFARDAATCAARVRQTEFAHLAPPTLRHKSRFLNLSKVAQWGVMVLGLLGEVQRGRCTADESRARSFFNWLRKHSLLIDAILVTTASLNRIMHVLKHQGLTLKSALEVKIECVSMGGKTPIAQIIFRWINNYLPHFARIGSLLCTSDIIESLFSRWKSVVGYHKNAEVNRLVLMLPALCGELTQGIVNGALSSVKISDIQAWASREIGTTLRMKRIKLRRAMKSPKGRYRKTAGNPFAKRA